MWLGPLGCATVVTRCDHCSFKFKIPICCSAVLQITIVFMHAQSNLDAERDVLRKIQRTAVAILEGCNAGSDISNSHISKPHISKPHISKPTPVLDTSSITLDLTFPHDIMAPIMAKVPEGIRQELLGCLTSRLNELQEQFLSFFRSTCSMARNANDLDAIRQGLENVFYRRCILPIQLELSRLPDISKDQKNRNGKRAFNNVSAYGCAHVYVLLIAILGIYAVT